MTKILYIEASPRGVDSKSSEIARAHIYALQKQLRESAVDKLELWCESLPEFDGNSAAAKMTFFGVGTLEGAKRTAWDRIVAITERFKAADQYVISTPMWNGGVPYRLKLYIDIITQPGLLFGFDPSKGYLGLLKNKSATIICTSGVYAPGVPASFGLDFQSNYLEWWLRCIGVEDVRTIRYQPTLVTADPAKGLSDALSQASAVA